MQGFTPDDPKQQDSPVTLVKDMLLYLIQKQKYKKYQSEDWFQLVNATHDFLERVDTTE